MFIFCSGTVVHSLIANLCILKENKNSKYICVHRIQYFILLPYEITMGDFFEI